MPFTPSWKETTRETETNHIVRLVRHNLKVDILTKKKTLKGTRYYIHEDLTPTRREILKYLRDNRDKVSKVWTTVTRLARYGQP